jgi:hypothetical protein
MHGRKDKALEHRIKRLALLTGAAALGLALTPAAANASTVRSASGTGWGTTWNTAIPAAEAQANGNLYQLARSYGEACVNITYTTSLYYIVPGGGGYVFSATATGTCSPA